MTAPTLCTVIDVQDYLGIDRTSTNLRYSSGMIGSNIRAAGAYLERRTGRFLGDQTVTLKFTTNGAAWIALPGVRAETSVTLAGATLTADSTYYMVPDSQQSGVYTAIQFRQFINRQTRFDGPAYLSNPEWFDRGLDLPGRGSYGLLTSLPNDLVIVGSVGYASGSVPEPVMHATKILAGYYTKRPDALLSGGITTESGSFDLSAYPIEVVDFIHEWSVGSMLQGVG